MKYRTETNNALISNHAQKLGLALILINDTVQYRLTQALSLKIWIEQAILHEQIEFLFSDFGDVRGYFTWAYITDAVASRLVSERTFTMHPSEWDEGHSLWIIDFCVPYGDVIAAVRHIRNKFLHETVNWARRNTGSAIRNAKQIKALDNRS